MKPTNEVETMQMSRLTILRTLRRSFLPERLTALLQHRRAGKIVNPSRQAGMTLLEIMIVLAIIALVMGLLVGPQVFKMFGESQEQVARTEMKQLVYQAYPRWAMRGSGSCPATLQELTEFTNKKDVKDPWGNEYTMHCGDNAPQGERFGVSSKGPDGKDGTNDDLKSWEDAPAK